MMIEGVDYFVRRIKFPNRASEALTLSNGDGTFTVFLNTLFPESVLEAKLQHELRHIQGDHFFGLT